MRKQSSRGFLVAAIGLCLFVPARLDAQVGTAFTYQGRLTATRTTSLFWSGGFSAGGLRPVTYPDGDDRPPAPNYAHTADRLR